MRKRFEFLGDYEDITRIIRQTTIAYEEDPSNRIALKRLVLWLGRYIVWTHNHMEFFKVENIFAVNEIYKTYVADLTYKEFMEIYPIRKIYDGDRWQTKDYFSTKKFLSAIDLDSKISNEENVMDLLWDYCNKELLEVGVAGMCLMSAMSRKLLGVDPAEAFLSKEENYAHDSKGNMIGVTADGKTHKVPSFWYNKKYQSNLRVIK